MKADTTELAFVFDRSGSMKTIRQASIDGFNQFLREHQASIGENHFSLVFFDSVIERAIESIPIAEVAALTPETYVPGGGTALLDAIGDTIDRLGERLSQMPEDQRPSHVSVAILTDGEENSSCKYTWRQVADRIKHQTEVYDWEFLFLGAGIDAIATATILNVHQDNATQYSADAAGQAAAMASISRKQIASRAKKYGMASDEQLRDADAPLDTILKEEDGKRR